MQHIDSDKLYADGAYRFEFVSKFMEFGKLYKLNGKEGLLKREKNFQVLKISKLLRPLLIIFVLWYLLLLMLSMSSYSNLMLPRNTLCQRMKDLLVKLLPLWKN